MGDAESNGGEASSAARTRDATDSNDAMDIPRDEIIVGSSNNFRSSPANITTDHEDIIMGDDDSQAQTKRKRSATTNGETAENPAGHNSASATRRASGSPPNSKVDITLGYWRESTVPDVKDRHAIVGFIDTVGRLRTRIVQTTRYGAPVPPEFERPSGTGSSWMTFESVVFENHLIGLDHNQIKEYVKIRTDAAGTPETPEEKTINEKAAVIEAKRRATAHPASDNHQTPQIAYGLDLPDFITMGSNAGRAEKKRRVTNNHAPAQSTENDTTPTPRSASPPSANPAAANGNSNGNANSGNEAMPARSPSVYSAIRRSALDLLPGTRPAKILVGYWRGSSEERIEDKHAVLGILGANDMFRVKVTRQTRDGRPVLGNFPVGAGALWINYDEVEFEQHIRHLSRPEMKEYVRVRQRQLDEGETPPQRHENETAAVYEAQARVLNAGGAAQSTLGNAGRVNTISFATAARLELEPARVAEMNDANKNNKNNENAARNGQTYGAASDGPQRRGSSGHELQQSRRSTMDQSEDASSVAAAAAAAVAAAAGTTSTARSTGRPSVSDASGRNDSSSNPNAVRIERTNDIARREITRIESLQQRNEQRLGSTYVSATNGATTGSANGNGSGNGNGIQTFVPGQRPGSAVGVNGGNSARQTFQENIGRLNKVWASQEASRLRADGEDAKIFRGVKYERKQTGPFQGKLVSPGTILSIDGEDYVEYRVLTKPTFF